MERNELMGSSESRRRELANFVIEPQKGGARGKSGAKKGASSAGKRTSSGAKGAAAGGKKAATGAKKSPSGAKKSPSGAKKTAAKGTARGASASKRGMNTQNQTKKRKTRIQENPVARRESGIFYVESDRTRRSRPAKGRAPQRGRGRGRRRKARGVSGLTFILMLVIALLVGVGAWRVQEYRALAEMKVAVSRQTFYEGTTVEGVDVSDMTLEQALEYWNTQIEPQYRQAAASLNDGTQVTAEQLGYRSDYAEVLSRAWSAGRTGSLEERYRRMAAAVARPTAYEVSRAAYDEALVRAYAANVAAQVDAQPSDASIKAFNVETYSFEFEPERAGRKLNQDALVRDIEAALEAGGGSVQMDVESIAPAVTQENISAQYGMIAYAVTNASSSSSNRLSNIRLSLELINGTVLEPGERFSFNEVVGQRTRDRGFKVATAYSSGKVTEEVGGGICQVSTTLFNAVVKADLRVDERHNHSLTVSYVDLGKDAAVDWGNKDLKFTNTSDDRVYIVAFLTEDKRVRVGVFGKLLEDGVTITLEGVQTGRIDYDTEYQMSFELFSGQTRVVQNGKRGYTATTYKIWWDAEGNEIRRSELCKSRYQSTTEIIEYGP